MFAKSLQLCLILHDPMDCSPPGSSVHGILQARILEWVTMPSSNRDDSGIEPESLASSALAGRFFTTRTTWKAPLLYNGDTTRLVPSFNQAAANGWPKAIRA